MELEEKLVQLSLEEMEIVSGGDNPGMGSYDGKGDVSVTYNATMQCSWTDYGARVRCLVK